MRKLFWFQVMAGLALLILTTGLTVADTKNATVFKTPDLLGKEVKNKAGEHIGYLEDLVVNLRDGRVAYAVLTYRDSVGFGGKMFALPLSAFTMADNLRSLAVDINKNDLESAAGFDANKWPQRVDERWTKLGKRETAGNKDIDRRDQKDQAADNKDQELRRLTSVNGLTVKNEKGQDLGKIAGFAIDMTHDRIVYAALSYGGVAGVGAKSFAIPWKALQLKSLNLRVQDNYFVLNANKEDFENSPGFDRNNWPIKGDQRFGSAKKTTSADRK
jgi:sporulation protein YlmC with PRC-barrel domain